MSRASVQIYSGNSHFWQLFLSCITGQWNIATGKWPGATDNSFLWKAAALAAHSSPVSILPPHRKPTYKQTNFCFAPAMTNSMGLFSLIGTLCHGAQEVVLPVTAQLLVTDIFRGTGALVEALKHQWEESQVNSLGDLAWRNGGHQRSQRAAWQLPSYTGTLGSSAGSTRGAAGVYLHKHVPWYVTDCKSMPGKPFKSHTKRLFRDNTNFYCLPFYYPTSFQQILPFRVLFNFSSTNRTHYSSFSQCSQNSICSTLHALSSSRRSSVHQHISVYPRSTKWLCNHTKLLDFEVPSTMTELHHNAFHMVTLGQLKQRPFPGYASWGYP